MGSRKGVGGELGGTRCRIFTASAYSFVFSYVRILNITLVT